MQTGFQSWGLYPPARQTLIRVRDASDLFSGTPDADAGWLPVGNGRSYGDSCLNDGGAVLDCRGLDRIVDFDAERGVVTCEAGVLLSAILERVVPKGWFLPVLPGTQYVTVGGAIANDIHGKNHHVRGTFGRWVRSFDLARSDGSVVTCSPEGNSGLFAATIGGLGLTGVITRAEIGLVRVAGPCIAQEVIRFASLEEFEALSLESDGTHEYSVAWIDSLASRDRMGRGIFIRGNHAPGPTPPANGRAVLSVPFRLPFSAINRASLTVFNEVYYRKQGARAGRRRTVPYQPFFFPLDAVCNWNRLYGSRGLLQHQCVVPREGGIETVSALLSLAQRRGASSFLTVLKAFGDVPSPGLLSFPRPGLTLTLDFANGGEKTLALLDELDEVVLAAGGRVNPYKDARMKASSFKAFYPERIELERLRDPALSSSFWRRVTR